MNAKENRPDAATSERIGAGKAAWGAFFPYHDFNTVPRRRQVSSFLRVGKERAIKLGDLAALTGMGERALRRQIQREATGSPDNLRLSEWLFLARDSRRHTGFRGSDETPSKRNQFSLPRR